jgi:hypothetical protein
MAASQFTDPVTEYTPAFTVDAIERLRELIAELSQLDLPLNPA